MAVSAIPELQEVFSTLLQLEREKPGTNKYSKQLDQPKPQWTGSFRLFDFPRELRDRIYFYYSYNPKGVIYRRSSRPDFITGVDGRHVALFLTCRQVYDEALEVFCRYNAVRIQFKSQLAGILRIFPDKPGAMLQRIQLVYQWPTGRQGLNSSWAQMIVESRVAKQYFPVLRECTALWYISIWSFLHHENLDLKDKSRQERQDLLLSWMRFWYREDKQIPPKWLRVEFTANHGFGDTELNAPFSQALEVFREEVKGDEVVEDLETSGQTWLEAMSQGPRKKKKRLKRAKESTQ
jgi:hypothetical protein